MFTKKAWEFWSKEEEREFGNGNFDITTLYPAEMEVWRTPKKSRDDIGGKLGNVEQPEEWKIPKTAKVQSLSMHNDKIFASPDALPKKLETKLIEELQKQY